VMLSMDFKRIWQSSRQGARPLSVWRPVGPPGYSALGDVAMPGREPPARPVSMYRDVPQQQVSVVHCCPNCKLEGSFAGCSFCLYCQWGHGNWPRRCALAQVAQCKLTLPGFFCAGCCWWPTTCRCAA
jgi:hypothetical protein